MSSEITKAKARNRFKRRYLFEPGFKEKKAEDHKKWLKSPGGIAYLAKTREKRNAYSRAYYALKGRTFRAKTAKAEYDAQYRFRPGKKEKNLEAVRRFRTTEKGKLYGLEYTREYRKLDKYKEREKHWRHMRYGVKPFYENCVRCALQRDYYGLAEAERKKIHRKEYMTKYLKNNQYKYGAEYQRERRLRIKAEQGFGATL